MAGSGGGRGLDLLQRNITEHLLAVESIRGLGVVIVEVGSSMARAVAAGNKLLFCGNGGSAADSQHLASELTGRFVRERKPLPAIALTTDSSALTCIGNDYSFEEVFARQVVALGRPGDVLIGISTSGNSRNVSRAVDAARAAGVLSVGLLGRDGGELRGKCDISIVVPSESTARIQECHILIGHTLCEIVENELGL